MSADDILAGPTEARVNECLSYSFFYYDSSTKDDLFRTLTSFYGSGEISYAKTQLFTAAADLLGAPVNRRDSPGRTAKEKDISDIIDAISKIDITPDYVSPVFAAINFDRVPPSRPTPGGQPDSSADRLTAIETQPKDLRNIATAHGTLLSNFSDTFASLQANNSSAVSARAPPGPNTRYRDAAKSAGPASSGHQSSSYRKPSVSSNDVIVVHKGSISRPQTTSTPAAAHGGPSSSSAAGRNDNNFRMQYRAEKQQNRQNRKPLTVGNRQTPPALFLLGFRSVMSLFFAATRIVMSTMSKIASKMVA